MEPVLISVTFFFCILAIVGAFIFTRHRERVLLIEKGLKPEDVRALYEKHSFRVNPMGALKWGFILVGVGVAILVAMVADRNFDLDEGIFFSMIAFFAGVALLLFYRVASRKISG